LSLLVKRIVKTNSGKSTVFASRLSSHLKSSYLTRSVYGKWVAAAVMVGAIASPLTTHLAVAQATAPAASANQPLTLLSDIQEANAVTGVITARGNVRINYPARQIQATSVQAQYYSRERRIVLSGNVYVLQNGNSIRGESITYLIDEGRFVATPDTGQQVEAVYIVPDPNPPAATPVAAAPAEPQADYNPKPEFKTPLSPPTP
jgi:lipopolysaccharide export system protein LptA